LVGNLLVAAEETEGSNHHESLTSCQETAPSRLQMDHSMSAMAVFRLIVETEGCLQR
jgi:hypothetical protein